MEKKDIISEIENMNEGESVLFGLGLMLRLGITSFDQIFYNGNNMIGKSGCMDKCCCNGNKQIKND